MDFIILAQIDSKLRDALGVLKEFRIENLELRFSTDSLTKDQQEAIKDKLKKLEIGFRSADETNDSCNQSILSLSSTSIDPKISNDFVKRTIRDRNLIYLVKHGKEKTNLLENTQESNNGKFIELKGSKKFLDGKLAELEEYQYEELPQTKTTYALCLKGTKFVGKLLKDHRVELRVVPIENKENYSKIVLYSKNKSTLREYKEKFDKILNKVVVLFEISKRYESGNEAEVICGYLEELFKKKCGKALIDNGIDYEFSMKEIHKSSKYVYFVFAMCEDSQFENLKGFLNKETAALCFLNIIPHRQCPLALKPNDDLNDDVQLKHLSDSSFLILGKSKYVKKNLDNLLEGIDTNVYNYRLRIKAREDSRLDTQSVNTGLAVTFETDKKMDTYVIINRWKTIHDLLEKHEELIEKSLLQSKQNKNEARKPLHENTQLSADEPTSIGSSTESIRGTKVEEHKSNGTLNNGNENQGLLNTPENQNDEIKPKEDSPTVFFNLDKNIPSDDCELLKQDDSMYQSIDKLLRKGYPGVHIISISCFNLAETWNKYVWKRNKFIERGIEEHLWIWESIEDPLSRFDCTEAETENMKRHFVKKFELKKNVCFTDEYGQKAILVCIAFGPDSTLNNIISFYPGFLVEFK